jgi:hypothetical protein
VSYVLATTENKVRWYKFPLPVLQESGGFELLECLDLHEVPCFGDKNSAKMAALALGLKTWRYVKV